MLRSGNLLDIHTVVLPHASPRSKAAVRNRLLAMSGEPWAKLCRNSAPRQDCYTRQNSPDDPSAITQHSLLYVYSLSVSSSPRVIPALVAEIQPTRKAESPRKEGPVPNRT